MNRNHQSPVRRSTIPPGITDHHVVIPVASRRCMPGDGTTPPDPQLPADTRRQFFRPLLRTKLRITQPRGVEGP
ncbi:hypothetical protein QP185_22225 [Sphingomonas aerolata]|uniref:hypothetical protein n=1 Tax=Sphingomonas aerolata TaxID=185951 RepID=UPI002FE1A36E